MTVLPLLGRTLSRQLASRTTCTPSALSVRVASAQTIGAFPRFAFSDISTKDNCAGTKRSYSTASETIKTPKTSAKNKVNTPKKAKPAKKTATKKGLKKTTSKPKSKPKAKAKAKKPVRPAVSPEQAAKRKATKALKDARAKTKNLKEISLLGKEPKLLPNSAWLILVTELSKGGRSVVTTSVANAAEKYKNLSPAEREHYNHVANENKAKNEVAYKKWVSSYSPAEIKAANHARKVLSKEKTPRGRSRKLSIIHDDRLVVGHRTAYIWFSTDRLSTGDYSGIERRESATLIGKEWKQLSASEKKPYQDKAEEDIRRYRAEYQTVYGEDIPSASRKKKN